MIRLSARLLSTLAVAALTLAGLVSCEVFGPLGSGPFDTVVVDAGHGGHANGARAYRGAYEKTVALDTAMRLAKNLRSRGFRVIVTRDSDRFVSLDQRVAISNRTRGCIFVSVHYNWSPSRSPRGIETYYYSDRSALLARNIQSELLEAYSTVNRGVKRRGFYVLRKNARPAVLVECGFVSNPSDNEVIQSARGRQRIADAIARGIVDTHRGRRP